MHVTEPRGGTVLLIGLKIGWFILGIVPLIGRFFIDLPGSDLERYLIYSIIKALGGSVKWLKLLLQLLYDHY
jgi:hypothetical protein